MRRFPIGVKTCGETINLRQRKLRGFRLHESHGAFLQWARHGHSAIKIADSIDKSHCLSGGQINWVGTNQQIERGRHANQPRQKLGAAKGGEQTQLHFGHSEYGAWRSNTVIRAIGNHHTATQNRTMHHGNHRLWSQSARFFQLQKTRRTDRIIEFRDIGARKKGSPFAGDYNGGCIASRSLRNSIDQRYAHMVRHRIDRRIIGLDQRECAVTIHSNGGVHAASFA